MIGSDSLTERDQILDELHWITSVISFSYLHHTWVDSTAHLVWWLNKRNAMLSKDFVVMTGLFPAVIDSIHRKAVMLVIRWEISYLFAALTFIIYTLEKIVGRYGCASNTQAGATAHVSRNNGAFLINDYCKSLHYFL